MTVFLYCLSLSIAIQAQNHGINFQTNPYTGAISTLTIDGDSHSMNWVLKTDGSQYQWIKEKYGWG